MSAESFGPGTLINGKYQLTELIGEGGMGIVWKAEDTKHEHRPVAIKFIHKGDDDRERRERFQREMQALARLDHPHIVNLIEFNETPEGVPYLVMNFVPGGSLQNRLDRGGFDTATRSRILKELCDALDYAHGQNVVHRDLTPPNILFDTSDHARISDFGLAKLVDTTYVVSVSGGTRRFQAPEQSAEALRASLDRGEQPTVDHRADIYSLGVIAWLLFTGQYPDDPPSPSVDRLSPDLKQALHKALAHHRENRYSSAGEFLEALASATSRRRRFPTWGWGLAGGTVLLLAMTGALLMRLNPEVAPRSTSVTVHTSTLAAVAPAPTGTLPARSTETPPFVSRSLSSAAPTSTFRPPSAPSPTPYLTVSDDKANVYDGPGQEYGIQKKVVQGDKLPILGRSEDGVWLCVDYLGWHLWIAVQSITSEVDVQALPTVNAPPTLVFRPPVIEEILVSTNVEPCSIVSVTCQTLYRSDSELTYIWEASNGFITGGGDSVSYNAPEVVGSQTITVAVQDGAGNEAKDSIQVDIVPANAPSSRSEPVGVFRQSWHQCGIRRKMGWAIGEEHTTPGVQQDFQHGVMFWRQDTDEIYVLIHDTDWQMYMDRWEEGMDLYSCPNLSERRTPPTPVRGFGKVWCEQLGGPYAPIGEATNHEQGYQAHWQRFEHGLMAQGLDGLVYVLNGDHSWQSYPSASSEGAPSCPGAAPQQVHVGDKARVCTAYHQLVVRAEPRRTSAEITRLEPGAYVTVVEGPACANDSSWWRVQTDSGTVGWVAEGGDDVDPYFICPER